MFGVARIAQPFDVDDRVRIGTAVFLALTGICFVVLGWAAFRRAKTTMDPLHPALASALVTNGIYRVTRNPMYVGLTAVLLGWAVFLAVPWTLLGPVAFVLFITRFQIIPEERMIRSTFGREYDEFRARVRRWL